MVIFMVYRMKYNENTELKGHHRNHLKPRHAPGQKRLHHFSSCYQAWTR